MYHVMELVTVTNTGQEEWVCPTCGRRFLLTWPPNYSKVILEVGDETANHSGAKRSALSIDTDDDFSLPGLNDILW